MYGLEDIKKKMNTFFRHVILIENPMTQQLTCTTNHEDSVSYLVGNLQTLFMCEKINTLHMATLKFTWVIITCSWFFKIKTQLYF